jgi:hypothetical protein
LAAKKAELLEATQREKEREEKLQKLAASVPYYDKIVSCSSDIHKLTKTREADMFQKDESGLLPFQHGEQRRNFFSDERLFSNARFRLVDALSRAGVLQTPYAHSIIQQMVPRQTERTTGIQPC